MKFVSWNVNGIRAAWNHGLSSFLDTCGADIYAFQETKTARAIPMLEIEGYHSFWSCCSREGYSGTMCLVKRNPLNVRYDMGDLDFDTEGRIITLEFEEFFFVNCYVPCSQRSESRYDYRNIWDFHFIQHLNGLRRQKPVIVCGDFNVTLSADDVYEENKRAELDTEGFQSTERENLREIVGNGFVDSYRHIHPDETGKYTWWSNRKFKRKENRGWRLDYFFVSDTIKEKITESTMLTDVLGSDHCPILLEIDMPSAEADDLNPVKRALSQYTYQDIIKLDNIDFANHIKNADLTNLWESIDWEQVKSNLKKIQMTLAKVANTKNSELITKWQKRIVYSLDAKLMAVQHTCETEGGTGVDGIKWTTPHEKMFAALSFTSKGYRAMPSRLLLVTSKNGKQRRIHIETYYDRAMQCLYAYALDPVAESWGDRKSFAYRKGRSAYDMNEYIKLGLSGSDAPTWVFVADVRRCYENISHDWIMENIPMSGYVLNQFLKAGYVFGGELFPTDVGVGIGCSISPIVANMTLDGLQEYVYNRLYPRFDDVDYPNGNMIRYADDILFMARTEETAEKIQTYVDDFLEERGLMLAPEKCKIINIRDGFTFMGRTYYKSGTQVFSRPSDKSIEQFMTSVREIIEKYTGSQQTLIEKLNRKIDGWTSYHKVGEADEVFRKMDVYIHALLIQLCESKHPKWDRNKILQKYWYVDGEGRHCYALPNKKEVRVKFLADTLLIDYYAVKTNLNPYIDVEYMERRSKEKQIINVTGVYRTIWNRQNGKCHYCGHDILRDEEKSLIEVDPSKSRFAARMAYVHARCLQGSFDYIDTASSPASLSNVRELLEQLEMSRKTAEQKYYKLSEFFRTCDQSPVTLTFDEIESIMGDDLGMSSRRREFWQKTGFMHISQCWLENGYAIKKLSIKDQQVEFHLPAKKKNTTNIVIPNCIKYGEIPENAKYELENYFKYIIKKYGL